MPSHLTRVVFRSIIANEPLLYRGCRNQTVRPHLVYRQGPRAFPQIQRRTFLDNLFKQRRKLKPAEYPAGLETLSELSQAQKTGVRPPQPQAVADAFKAFFAQRKGAYDDFYIQRAHTAFTYLLENPRDDGQPWLSAEHLDANIFRKLVNSHHLPKTGGSEHVRFGKAILQEYAKLREQALKDEASPEGKQLEITDDVALKTVKLLSLFGEATEARNIAASVCTDDTNVPTENEKLLDGPGLPCLKA